MNTKLNYIILFEGFASIAVEILTIRQLLPVAGGSVVVTSLIIGFFLLFLAFGYQYGGQAKQDPQKTLQRNFLLAALWIGIGLSYIFIDLFFFLVQKIFGPHIIYPLIAYLLLVTAPLIFILGQTVPISMNMSRVTGSIGKIGGNVLGLSTVGSFLGATITTLVLMHFFGVASTVTLITLALLLSAFILVKDAKQFLLCGIAAVLIVAITLQMNIKVEKKYFELADNYANYQIQTTTNLKNSKTLIINDTLSSHIDTEQHAYPYIEAIKKILFTDLNMRARDILVLGAGGFTLTAEKTQTNNFTYVDIDPKITQVVFPKFLAKPNSHFKADDARHYLQSTSNQYDVIISDTYTDTKSIPANLITREYMLAIKKRLKINGIAFFNIIANPMLSDPYSKGIDNTIRSVFNSCMAMPLIYANINTNIIYACRVNQADLHVYSDNLNHSTTDSFAW